MSKEIIKNRYDYLYLVDVIDGNPNGDPDAGNLPRIDSENGSGLISDVCLKRKIRNYVQIAKSDEDGFDIFIKERAVLDNEVKKVCPDDKSKDLKKIMCEHFYDVRTFGAVLATKNSDSVRGPVQMTFGRSINPIFAQEHSITRMAATKEADAEKGKTMGRKYTVPYGLYLSHGFVSANFARQTGFNEDDLNLLWDALKNMFDQDHSAARGLMSPRKLIVFKHASELGNAPANQLFDLVKIDIIDTNKPPRSFTDYKVTIARDKLPEGVELIEML
ncbi:MAG: type I-C CRISPR-associated protein Cas7/Csd2 [Muribaculaceae bacterium]|jgi:CRISPR-associated protein Csd2|nr:type I-C CRISPR-associated protein Cas7/Csd2 [Muribaculaceae bacterium]